MGADARLIQRTGDAPGREIPLQEVNLLGRSSQATIQVMDSSASKQHAEVRRDGMNWLLTDLGSTNGTFLDGQRLGPHQPTPLREGSILRIGGTEFACASVSAAAPVGVGPAGYPPVSPPAPYGSPPGPPPPYSGPSVPSAPSVPSHGDSPSMVFAMKATLTVGRHPSNDIVLDFPNVSRHHCRITHTDAGAFIEDLKSNNGTFLNNVRIGRPEKLLPESEVRIGLSRFVFRNGRLELYDQNGMVRVETVNLNQVVQKGGKPLQLLHEVSVVIQPKEFVAIVGASGAGKSTLMKAMNGFRPASQGQVRFNGVDLYSHIDMFRAVIGYVPQDDIVHRELTVDKVLRYAAQLRLPPDTDAGEIERLIDNVLRELELSHRKTASVSTLSGGERKRVNVAVELLTKPSLLFLDEPTSGLDPGLELKFIELVKRLTNEGRTIIMVTHATSSIAACDKLLFMARGGRIAFFGKPEEALRFFGVTDYALAYGRVNDDSLPPDYWENAYRQSEYYQRYIRQPLEQAKPHRHGETMMVAKALGATRPRRSPQEQFNILCRRYVDTLKGDPKNMGLLLAQAPVIAALLMAVFKPETLQNPTRGPLLLFCLVVSALLFGIVNAARELTKEAAIFQRERLVNLEIMPYLLSKIAVMSGLCVIQSALLLLMIQFRITIDSGALPGMYVTLLMANICGMLLGLCVSAVATTNDQAMSLVPLAVLPQIIFSGLIDIDTIAFVSKAMPSYWAYGVLGNLANMRLPDGRYVKSVFETTTSQAWPTLAIIGLAYAGLSYWLLQQKEKRAF